MSIVREFVHDAPVEQIRIEYVDKEGNRAPYARLVFLPEGQLWKVLEQGQTEDALPMTRTYELDYDEAGGMLSMSRLGWDTIRLVDDSINTWINSGLCDVFLDSEGRLHNSYEAQGWFAHFHDNQLRLFGIDALETEFYYDEMGLLFKTLTYDTSAGETSISTFYDRSMSGDLHRLLVHDKSLGIDPVNSFVEWELSVAEENKFIFQRLGSKEAWIYSLQ